MLVWVGVLGGQVAVSCGAGDIYLVLGVVGHVGLSGGEVVPSWVAVVWWWRSGSAQAQRKPKDSPGSLWLVASNRLSSKSKIALGNLTLLPSIARRGTAPRKTFAHQAQTSIQTGPHRARDGRNSSCGSHFLLCIFYILS